MGADLIALTVFVVVITAGGLFIASRPVTPSRRTELLERIARSLERLEHVHGVAADDWRAVLQETSPNAATQNPPRTPSPGDVVGGWVDEHREAVVQKLDAIPASDAAPRRATSEYAVGHPIWIHGVTEGMLHPGVIVHRFKLVEGEDPTAWEYIIQYSTSVGAILAVRNWFGLSETALGPINLWRRQEID